MYSFPSTSHRCAPAARSNVSGAGRLASRTFELTPPAMTRERRACSSMLLAYRVDVAELVITDRTAPPGSGAGCRRPNSIMFADEGSTCEPAAISSLRRQADEGFDGACETQRSRTEWHNPRLPSLNGFRATVPTESTGTLGDDENCEARLVEFDTVRTSDEAGGKERARLRREEVEYRSATLTRGFHPSWNKLGDPLTPISTEIEAREPRPPSRDQELLDLR